MEQDTIIEQRKRKFLIMLPLLTLPFITFLFYSLGGGKGDPDKDARQTSALSTTLPDPILNENEAQDKLSLYQRAARDSQQQYGHDPYAPWMPADTNNQQAQFPYNSFNYPSNIPLYPSVPPLDQQLQQSQTFGAEQKIAQLQRQLEMPDEPELNYPSRDNQPEDDISPELQRLEAMMSSISDGSATANPELEQAASLMDKILDVQHPERVRQRVKEQSLQNKKSVFPVTTVPVKEDGDLFNDSSIQSTSSEFSNGGFYDEESELAEEANAVRAAVHESQILTSGATIKIRLEQDAYVQGQLIPKGSFVFGICALNGERLEVTINSIRNGNSIYPVSLVAYDMDGLPGIRIPGSIGRDASKESSDRALQTLNISSLDPSVGAQAAAAGIEAAKNLLSRKVKLIKVMVKSGYPLLLAPDKSNS